MSPSGRYRARRRWRGRNQGGELGVPVLLCLQQLQQFFDAARVAEQLALSKIAAVVAQEFKLAHRLDALGDDLHPEAVTHVNDGPYQHRIGRIFGGKKDDDAAPQTPGGEVPTVPPGGPGTPGGEG